MSIKADDIIRTVRGLLSEDNEKYFKDTFLVHAINSATDHAYAELQTVHEFQWLVKGSITIDAADVTAQTRSYALPARTMYVSNFCVTPFTTDEDWRPHFLTGVDDRTWLVEMRDYSVSLPNFVLHTDPVNPGTIWFWYKASPAPITSPAGEITVFPDIARTYYIEYVNWYAQRRDENVDAITIPQVNAELRKLAKIITNSYGPARGFEPNWQDVADYGEY